METHKECGKVLWGDVFGSYSGYCVKEVLHNGLHQDQYGDRCWITLRSANAIIISSVVVWAGALVSVVVFAGM